MCDPGFIPCDGVCVDPATDALNCGACGHACADDEICTAGACMPRCTAPLTWCTDACVDASTDRNHCGACGHACPGTEVCRLGACVPASADVGCADGTVEVRWSATVHGCRGPTQTWQAYYDARATYCAPGWRMATGHIVNTYLTGPGYTDDVKYAFDGGLCDPSGWVFATRYDSYSQPRSSCGWLESHHWSLGVAPGNPADGIVCER
jgi:hypothetical protein